MHEAQRHEQSASVSPSRVALNAAAMVLVRVEPVSAPRCDADEHHVDAETSAAGDKLLAEGL